PSPRHTPSLHDALPISIAGLDATRVDTEDYPVFTSNTIMRRPTQPERLVIIGSGVIAMEFAHVFAAFGTEVTEGGEDMGELHGEDRKSTRLNSSHVSIS